MNRWQYVVGLALVLFGGDLRWASSHHGVWWGLLTAVLISVGLYLITENVFVDRLNQEKAAGRVWPPAPKREDKVTR